VKFKLTARSIESEEVSHVIDLADMGMSRKLIAKEIYGSTSDEEPTPKSMMRVHHILRDYGVRVTDYRNGKNKHGKSVIAAIRRDSNILQSIRLSGKMLNALIRKAG